MMVVGFVGIFVVFLIWHVQSTQLTTMPAILQVGKRNQKLPQNDPLIVLIDAGNNHQDILDVIDKEKYELTDEDINNPEEDAKYMFYSYLKKSPEDDKDPEIKQQKDVLRTALRKRCDKLLRCREECGYSEEEYCPVNCQDVFDHIMMCNPPKKKKYDPCQEKPMKCGKTLPPRWKFK